MTFTKTNEAESLDINAIQSFMASQRERSKAPVKPDDKEGIPTVHGGTERETILTIITKDGKRVALCGEQAERALEILHQHGF